MTQAHREESNMVRPESSNRQLCQPRNLTHTNWNFRGILILTGFLLILLTMPTLADNDTDDLEIDWRSEYEGHGTTHEQMGQPHWSEVEYTEYVSKLKFSKNVKYPLLGMQRVFNATHYLFDNILNHDPAIPMGYVVIKGEDTLALGPKVEANDWHDLVGEYWFMLFWLFFLLLIIILLPFIAVCYCCFCCCYRCNPGCPPCDRARNFQRRMIFGFLLLLLILLILLGGVIAFLCNRLLDRGIRESAESMRQGSDDICTFLKNVKEHINHLFINNYEELLNHLSDILTNAHTHMFYDLGDTSEANALEELERIFDNLPTALELMKDVSGLEKRLRFLTDQLRDAIRGVKRDVNDACSLTENSPVFLNFLRNTLLEFIDTSVCLHIDQLPDTSVYVEGIKEVISAQAAVIPKQGIIRFQSINDLIMTAIGKIGPQIMKDLSRGRDTMIHHANRIQLIIEAIISDIHLNTLRSTQSFEDFYDKYGINRTIVNMCACILIFIILIFLIFGLVCGCFASRATGASCLLLAIMFIFCAISFITLVGLFYFILGIVTYHGGCAPFKDKEASEVFRKLDAIIDLNQYIRKFNTEEASPPLRMSNAISACQEHQSIFSLLRDNNIFDINDLIRISLLFDHESDEMGINTDLSGAIILTLDEASRLETLTKGNLTTYHSTHYLENVCTQFTPVPLKALATQVRHLADDLYTKAQGHFRARSNLFTAARFLDAYQLHFVNEMQNVYDKLKKKLHEIDELILYNNLDFGSTISVLLTSVIRSEKFIQNRGKMFISSLVSNLTEFSHIQVDRYFDMLISDCNLKVGLCEPLAYIYYRGVDVICTRLVDPINGFWLGLLPCALLFLPALFVAHRLMCLFKKPLPIAERADILESGRLCPNCTGVPFVAPPLVVCSGGQQEYCVCSSANSERRGDGVSRSNFVIFEDHPQTETVTEEEAEPSVNKRKQD